MPYPLLYLTGPPAAHPACLPALLLPGVRRLQGLGYWLGQGVIIHDMGHVIY